jgi:hypothetical protein
MLHGIFKNFDCDPRRYCGRDKVQAGTNIMPRRFFAQDIGQEDGNYVGCSIYVVIPLCFSLAALLLSFFLSVLSCLNPKKQNKWTRNSSSRTPVIS